MAYLSSIVDTELQERLAANGLPGSRVAGQEISRLAREGFAQGGQGGDTGGRWSPAPVR